MICFNFLLLMHGLDWAGRRDFYHLTIRPRIIFLQLILYTLVASQVVQLIKILPATAGDSRNAGSIPGLGRCPGVGNGTPVFLPENSLDRGAWQATVHGLHTAEHAHKCTQSFVK